jgi:hypothetical protein
MVLGANLTHAIGIADLPRITARTLSRCGIVASVHTTCGLTIKVVALIASENGGSKGKS